MSYRKLKDFLERHRAAGAPLVMATVFETRGSTYSKAGARMLIDGEGRFQGMLSGGCLEGDLAMRARVVLESGQAQFATYDLASESDELWGMGVGCAGVMQVILQALDPARDYAPAAQILDLMAGREALTVITCLESADPQVAAGSTVVRGGAQRHAGSGTALLDGFVGDSLAALGLRPGEARIVNFDTERGTLRALVASEAPVPRLLVLGAGADAEPLVRFAAELGWLCTISDHRPAYVDANDFSGAQSRICVAVDAVAEGAPARRFRPRGSDEPSPGQRPRVPAAACIVGNTLHRIARPAGSAHAPAGGVGGLRAAARGPAARAGRPETRRPRSGGDCIVDRRGDAAASHVVDGAIQE